MTHYYKVKVSQDEGGKVGAVGRVGTLSEPENDNFAKIKIQSPAEFLGPKSENGKSLYWTPEDLYVSSVAVCIFTTFIKIAQNSHLKFKGFEVVAEGKMEENEDGESWFSEIVQDVTVFIADEKYKRKALRIVEKAEENCLIARSMKTKVITNPKAEIRKD